MGLQGQVAERATELGWVKIATPGFAPRELPKSWFGLFHHRRAFLAGFRPQSNFNLVQGAPSCVVIRFVESILGHKHWRTAPFGVRATVQTLHH